jgi:hypothetical protein
MLNIELTLYTPRMHMKCRYKLLGPGRPEGVPGPDYVAHVLSFTIVSLFVDRTNLILLDQAQVPVQRGPVFLIFNPSALTAGTRKFFSPGPNPVVGGHVYMEERSYISRHS